MVQMRLLANKLNCGEDFFDSVKADFRHKEHRGAEMLFAKLNKLKEAMKRVHQSDLLNDLGHIEFSCCAHFIFITWLLNKKARLVKTPDQGATEAEDGWKPALAPKKSE